MREAFFLVASLLLAEPDASYETATSAASAVVSYEQIGSRMAVARVRNWVDGYRKDGPAVSGTGTLTAVFENEGLVITAGHLFENKVGPITVEFNDGQASGARILAIDHKLDVAALWIFAPKRIEPMPIADQDPMLGQPVEIWGYGPKRFRSFRARVSRPIPMESDEPRTLVAAQGVENKQVTIPGDSGGPIVADGRIVAVHWGYRGAEEDPRRCVHAVGCHRLTDWLKSELDPSIWQRALAFSSN
jgi:hypothetical protein